MIEIRVLWYPLFLLLHAINEIIQDFLSSWRQQPTTDRQAQVLDVKYRYKYDAMAQPASLSNFILVPRSWENTDYILRHNVSLYCLNETQAVFVETAPHNGRKITEDPFLKVSQFKTAQRVVILPITLFVKYAEILDAPENKVIILRNCGRCGSTLMCQMFDKTGSCVSLSEPSVMKSCRMLMDNLPEDTIRMLLQCSLKFLIRSFCDNKSDTTVIVKLDSHESHLLPMLSPLLPNAAELFMYRDLVPMAFSFAKIMSVLAHPFIHLNLAFNFPILYNHIMKKLGYGAERYPNIKLFSFFTVGFFEPALNCRRYLQHRLHEKYVGAVKYELLEADPIGQMQKILAVCGLPTSWAEGACEALKHDSQKGTQVAGRGVQTRELNKTEINLCNTICDILKLPQFDEDFVLEGTII